MTGLGRWGWGVGGDFGVQVSPVRVGFLDDSDLPGTLPSLDRLLSGDRGLHGFVHFEPDEVMGVMAPGESLDDIVAMLPDACGQVRCNTDVQRAVALTGKYVNAGVSFAHVRYLPDL